MFLFSKLNHPDQLLNKSDPQWFDVGQPFSNVKGVIAFSPFWVSKKLYYGSIDNRPIRFDFPIRNPRVKRLVFRGNRSPYLAQLLKNQLSVPIRPKPSRALDHGVWAPMRMTFPADTVPVLQVSCPPDLVHTDPLIHDLIQLAHDNILILFTGLCFFHLPYSASSVYPDPLPPVHRQIYALYQSLTSRFDHQVLRSSTPECPADPYSGHSICCVRV